MQKERKSKSNFRKAGVHLGTIIGIFIVCFILIMNIQVEQEEHTRTWHVIWQGSLAEAAENSPVAGATGWLQIFFVNHTATPDTAYDENTSSTIEGWCTANMAGKTPYGTADEFRVELDNLVSFDIVVRARWNATHAKNATIFDDSRCRIRMNFTCTSWADGEDKAALTEGNLTVSYNNSGAAYIWCNVYWNADDYGGYQLNPDAVLTIPMISIEAEY